MIAILHASPGTECWAGLHSALKKAATEAPADAPLVYAHRPVLPAACKVRQKHWCVGILHATRKGISRAFTSARCGTKVGILPMVKYICVHSSHWVLTPGAWYGDDVRSSWHNRSTQFYPRPMRALGPATGWAAEVGWFH